MFTVLLACYFAFTFMVAGLAKVDNPHTLAATLRATRLLPDALIQPLTKIISWGEIVVAVWLVSGVTAAPRPQPQHYLRRKRSSFCCRWHGTPAPLSARAGNAGGRRNVESVVRWLFRFSFLIKFSESPIPREAVGLSPLSERRTVPNRDSLKLCFFFSNPEKWLKALSYYWEFDILVL
jgi:hypothetical protein